MKAFEWCEPILSPIGIAIIAAIACSFGCGLFAGFLVGAENGRTVVRESMEQQAVARGYGRYQIENEKSAFEFTRFQWNEPTSK